MSVPPEKMLNPQDQSIWLTDHLPYRIRAATARLKMDNSVLGEQAIINPKLTTDKEAIYWRFATDAIWEGRLATARWLIEFVGIVRSKKTGKAHKRKIDYTVNPHDIDIEHFPGGECISPGSASADILAEFWKGCSQASGHATHNSNHPSTSDDKLTEVMSIVVGHLSGKIYKHAVLAFASRYSNPQSNGL